MARKRIDPRKNAGLPKRWRHRDGAYYYRPAESVQHLWDGKSELKLGNTLDEAYKAFNARQISVSGVRTIRDLADEYEREIVPLNAPPTQKSYRYCLRFIRDGLGHIEMRTLDTDEIREFLIAIAKSYSVRQASLVRGVLSHMYSYAIEHKLYNDKHPIKLNERVPTFRSEGWKLHGIKKLEDRDRYVDDSELAAIYSIANPVIKAYLPLRLTLGQRVGDILQIKLRDITDEEIRVKQSKTNQKIAFKFKNPDGTENGLRALVEDAYAACRKKGPRAKPFAVEPDHLFCNRKGRTYYNYKKHSHSGWDSSWQRLMQKAREKGLISAEKAERFTDHDLRAKAGSDAVSLQDAQRLMGHTNAEMTKRVYRRKGETVNPLVSELWSKISNDNISDGN